VLNIYNVNQIINIKKSNIMSIFQMSEEEKKRILEKHKEATKNHYTKKQETKEGLKKPEEKTDNKKTS
jgi:hypothetical protein